ncbi:MAG: hypothetical protein ABS79_07010 [Planctomycetes bacterium SCN 63-9]|nr:MAG: hypothetical protein ABS79_07010 [Planctomycetes bacterium SCN 63-9]
MISINIAHATLAVYAALLAVGGIVGFLKARSNASLIAGLVSAIAALVALALSLAGYRWGIALGSLLAIVLFLFFGSRYALRNRKFMPAGMMAVVSLIVLGIMIAVTDWTAR